MSDPRLSVSKTGPTPRERSAWWSVHASRYWFAAPHVAGCHVLDVACGTGYGLPILATTARTVVGVDADFDAVRIARTEEGSSSRVLVSDGARLPFRDSMFDAVTSFETIEHLRDRATFASELRRVLHANGVCVVSTPNAMYTQPLLGVPRNPFHVHEYTPLELCRELGRLFGRVDLLGQSLSPRFTISPFWDDQRRLPRRLGPQTRRFVWRALNRLPQPAADCASRALWGHPLIPGERDYNFDAAGAEDAPVLVAICRGVA